jgi:hypothetical protein
MKDKSRTGRPDHNPRAVRARVFVLVSRCLLMLTTLSLITMPITEHLWTWDCFLQGGRDFELSSIALLSFLCLVMVLSRTYKQCVDVLFSVRDCSASTFDDHVGLSVVLAGAFLSLEKVAPLDPGLCGSQLTLQI